MLNRLQHRLRSDVTIVVEILTGLTALTWGITTWFQPIFSPPSSMWHQLSAQLWGGSHKLYALTFISVALAQYIGIALDRPPIRRSAAKCAAALWGFMITNYAYSGTLPGAALTVANFLGELFVLGWWALEDSQRVE